MIAFEKEDKKEKGCGAGRCVYSFHQREDNAILTCVRCGITHEVENRF